MRWPGYVSAHVHRGLYDTYVDQQQNNSLGDIFKSIVEQLSFNSILIDFDWQKSALVQVTGNGGYQINSLIMDNPSNIALMTRKLLADIVNYRGIENKTYF